MSDKNKIIIPIEQQWENLDISNDYIFGKVMQDKELCSELITRILPDIEIGRIEFPERQKIIAEGIDVRSVRFDIYTRSEYGSIIDIEMQMLNSGDLPQRTRGYHINIGMNAMNKDLMHTYHDLPTAFVIFICVKFDPFRKGRHIYTFQNICREDTSIYLNDGTFTIFLTPLGTKNDVSDKLKSFLNFAAGKITPDDPFISRLERRVKEVKQNTDWRMEYMTLLLRDQENIRKGELRGNNKMLNAVTRYLKKQGIMDLKEVNNLRNSMIEEFRL